MRAIDSLSAKIQTCRASMRDVVAETADHQGTCPHEWSLHSQRLKNQESGKWWIHRVCTACDFADTKLEDVPICPECYVPLVGVELDVAAEEVKKMALAEDPYATLAFAFECACCGSLYGFAFRDKEKKE